MYETNEDQEVAEMLDQLNERLNVEQSEIDGESRTILHKGYASRHLFEIEKFVKKIEKTGWRCGFVEEVTHYAKVRKIRELYLGKEYYQQLNEWLERYADIHRYSARIEAFYDVCKELGLIGRDIFVFEKPGDATGVEGMRYMDLFNLLIERVHARCQTREFKEHERLRRENAGKNERNVLAMEKAMFEVKGRWLILSLTLRYKANYRRWITPETIQKHRERLFKARRFNKLMSGIKNYVWGIEQGEDTGLHLHVILFYSAEHNHDQFIARQIGEYWVGVVTQGKGEYWNSNDRSLKPGYEKRGHGIGVGQINHNDTAKRGALRKNLVYLAKAEQYLMIKGAENMHTFDMGRVSEKLKSGRPRVEAGNASGNLTDAESFDETDARLALFDEAEGE